jgi:hypothetical protein
MGMPIVIDADDSHNTRLKIVQLDVPSAVWTNTAKEPGVIHGNR